MSDAGAIGLAVFLLAANAFFVGAEFALISARRSSIEPRARTSRAARLTLWAMERVSLHMAGAQLGITLCTLGLGYLGEPAVAHLLEPPFEAIGVPEALVHPIAFAIALGLIGYLHVVLGEMVPKNLALALPDRTVLILAPLLVGVVKVLHPFIWTLNTTSNGVLLLLRVQPKDEVTSAFSRDEVAGLVEESRREGLLDPAESRVLASALELEDRTIGSVILGIDRLETVAPGATPEDVEAIAARTGFSRFPLADLEGYLHLKDALETDPDARVAPVPHARIRPLPDVPSDATLRAALETMQRDGAHVARAVDHEGEPVGAVWLEDLLEELVGEIRDINSAARS